MRFTANSWPELGSAPRFGRGLEIAVVAFAVGAVASGSVVSSLLDKSSLVNTAVNSADAPVVVARGLSGDGANSADRERIPAVPTLSTHVPVPAPVSRLTETPPSAIAAAAPPAEAAPIDAGQNSDARSLHSLRRRSHSGYWSRIGERFSERSARVSEMSRGSISSQR
jgi:hypothetical protein